MSARFFQFFTHLNLYTLRKTIVNVGQQRLPGLAAEMAYNTLLAMFPAILAVLTAIGLFAPLTATFNQITAQISEIAPVEVLTLVQDFAGDISTSRNGGLFSLSFAIALWTSSGALVAAMTALDQIHRIPPSQWRPFWQRKLVSIGLTIGTILLLLAASILLFVGDWLVRRIASQSGGLEPGLLTIWRLFIWPVALGIISIAFAFVYRYGPSRWNPGQPIFPGAVLAAVSWALLSSGFRLYVSNFGDYNRAYGAIGAVIVLQIWLYLGCLVMLVGDQLNVTVGEAMQKQAAMSR